MAGSLIGLFSGAAGMAAGGGAAAAGSSALGSIAGEGMMGTFGDIAQNGLSLDKLIQTGGFNGGGAPGGQEQGQGSFGSGSTSQAQLLQAQQPAQVQLQQAAQQGQGGMMLDPSIIAQLAQANKFGV